MATLSYYVLLVCFVATTSFASLCPGNGTYEALDPNRLSKMSFPLYDVIDIPAAKSHVDCWDVKQITGNKDGFVVTYKQQMEGRPAEDSLELNLYFVHNGDGTYKLNPKNKQKVIETSKESVKHKADEKMLQEVEDARQKQFASTYFFLTDYKKYFILSKCAPGNRLIGFMKHIRKRPSGKDVVDLWNEFAKYGESTTVDWEEYCTSRKETKQSIVQK
uniref:uncharacterized protein LOC120348248 n=1 Tax=Styela clava TaxID=7725 RepID=UPI0019394AC6|nr:uncharacterized protein LOC120348248 [Styela clava]